MKIKVLLFVDRLLTGGIQTLLINLIKELQKKNVLIEMLLLDDGNTYPMEKEFKALGVTLNRLEGIWIRRISDYIIYHKRIDSFFREHHDYDAVHVHSSSKNYLVLKYAKKYGIPVRIAHSHNSGFQSHSIFHVLFGNLLKHYMIKYSTQLLACSEKAGAWLFGEKRVNNGEVKILRNGINLREYSYNPEMRNAIRSELKWENHIIIGNVGRFAEQKNHRFLIQVFYEIHKMNPSTILVLVGTGDLIDDCRKLVDSLDLSMCVQFLGFRSDIKDLIQGMDLFLMPSLYEGFPVTAVEAQASGLPCVFSNTITQEIKLLDKVKFISLNASAAFWAEECLSLINDCGERTRSGDILREKGFDICDMAKELERIYTTPFINC